MPQLRQTPTRTPLLVSKATTVAVLVSTPITTNDAWLTGLYFTSATAGDSLVITSTGDSTVQATLRTAVANQPVYMEFPHPVFCLGGFSTFVAGTGAVSVTTFYAEQGV